MATNIQRAEYAPAQTLQGGGNEKLASLVGEWSFVGMGYPDCDTPWKGEGVWYPECGKKAAVGFDGGDSIPVSGKATISDTAFGGSYVYMEYRFVGGDVDRDILSYDIFQDKYRLVGTSPRANGLIEVYEGKFAGNKLITRSLTWNKDERDIPILYQLTFVLCQDRNTFTMVTEAAYVKDPLKFVDNPDYVDKPASVTSGPAFCPYYYGVFTRLDGGK